MSLAKPKSNLYDSFIAYNDIARFHIAANNASCVSGRHHLQFARAWICTPVAYSHKFINLFLDMSMAVKLTGGGVVVWEQYVDD